MTLGYDRYENNTLMKMVYYIYSMMFLDIG